MMKWHMAWIDRCLLGVALFSSSIMAVADGMDPLSSLENIPSQQFVTTTDDPASSDVVAVNTTPGTMVSPTPAIPLQPSPMVATVVPVTPNTVQPNLPLTQPIPGTPITGIPASSSPLVQAIPTPSTNLPLTPTAVTTPPTVLPPANTPQGAISTPVDAPEVTNPEFAGGLNNQAFVYCSRLAAVSCNQANDNAAFRGCLATITLPACKQFILFASLTNFNAGDTVDATEHYNQGQIDLIHVKRYGINYPGDYFAIGGKGTFYNLTSGPDAQAINISASANFPAIQQRYSNAQLWSIVEKPPQAESLPDNGLRLVFRFKILNGCATCEAAGYANIAYDFTPDGILKQVQLLSLDAE